MTTPEEHDDAVRQILDDRGWQLVADHAQFVHSVSTELQAEQASRLNEIPAHALLHAVIHQYCFVLHAASGEEGTLHQRGAFRELWRYLYRIALSKVTADIAEECTQQALANIWRRRDQCHDPGSFLNWCSVILVNLIRDHYRSQNSVDEETMSELEPAEHTAADERKLHEKPGPSAPAVEPVELENVSHEQLREQLVDALGACLKNADQRAIIIGLFFFDKTFKELAEQLQTSIGNVQTMKSRALASMRNCQESTQLYQEWFDRLPPSLSSPL